jgi:hypothetical protein
MSTQAEQQIALQEAISERLDFDMIDSDDRPHVRRIVEVCATLHILNPPLGRKLEFALLALYQ